MLPAYGVAQACMEQPLTIPNRANATTHRICGKLCANLPKQTQEGTSVLSSSRLHSNVVNSQSVEKNDLMFIFLRINGLERGVHAVGCSSKEEVDVFNNLVLNLCCIGELEPSRGHRQQEGSQDCSRFTFLGTRFTSRGRSGRPPFSHALTITDATAVIESFRRRSRMGRTCPKNWSK